MNLAEIYKIFLATITVISVASDLSSNKCNNMIPFAKDFQCGYDLAEFSPFICLNNDGRKGQIFDINRCSSGRKHQMRDINATEYLIADGMTTLSFHTATAIYGKRIYNNFNDYYNDHFKPLFSLKEYNKYNLAKGLFIKNEDYQEFNLYTGDFNFGVVSGNSKEVGLNFPLEELRRNFNATFLSDVKALPKNLKNNEELYLNFTRKYGTHVMVKGIFGGVNHRLFLDVDEMSENLTKNFLQLSGSDMDVMCNKVSGNSRMIRIRDNTANFVQDVIGGKANNYLNITVNEWIESVKQMPSLISADMIPISDLIDDKHISNNVYEAIHIYMMDAYREFHGFHLITLSWIGYNGRNETIAIKDKNDNIKKEDKYNATFLELLGDELKDECNYLKLFGKPTKPNQRKLFIKIK